MDTINSLLAVLLGLILRLAIPIAVTAALIYLLRRLDARWQSEAQAIPTEVEKPKCWEINNCPPEQIKNCIAAKSPLPCWQVYRDENGHLLEKCLDCKVFRDAPVPA